MRRRSVDLELILIVLALIGVALLPAFFVWREVVHPCVRYIESTCSECRTNIPVFDGAGNLTNWLCVEWADVPCTKCAERKP